MPATSPDAPFIVSSTLTFSNAMGSMLDYIFSGTMERFPNLVIAYSEGQVGWMPYVIERADKLWEERADNSFGTSLPQPPSSYMPRPHLRLHLRRRDRACATVDLIGMDQICFETDYPHADSTFPHSKEIARRHLRAGRAVRGGDLEVPAGQRHPLLRARAVRHHRVGSCRLDAATVRPASAKALASRLRRAV